VVLHFSPLLLLGDITGLLWLGGTLLVLAFFAIMAVIFFIGKETCVANAASEPAKSKRKAILVVVAPFLAIIVLWYLLFGF
jgi:hypothetical protein